MNTCTKVKFATEAYCLQHIKKKQETSKDKTKSYSRAYLCPYCSSWHITSQKNKQIDHLETQIQNLKAEIQRIKESHSQEIQTIEYKLNKKLLDTQEIADNRKEKIENQKILLKQQYDLIKSLKFRLGYLK